MICSKPLTSHEKMLFLKKYTGTKVHEVISTVSYKGSEQTFLAALRKLEERYGCEHYVVQEFRSKLDAQRNIGHHDYTALRSFADLLSQVQEASLCIPSLKLLDDVYQIIHLAKKLPETMRRMWAKEVHKTTERENRYPSYAEFCNFVVQEARTYNNPVLKTLFERPERVDTTKKKTLSTSTVPLTKPTVSCLYCKREHDISVCNAFKSLSAISKDKFIKKHGVCYGCLAQGHRTSRCKRRATCTDCNRRHPTSICGLFNELYSARESTTSSAKPPATRCKRSTNSKTTETRGQQSITEEKKSVDVKNTMSLNTSSDENTIFTLTVPVYVSSRNNPENEILTYALLDTQSDSSFILQDIASELQAACKETQLELTTMHSKKNVRCFQYDGLQVRGMNSSNTIVLPPTYSRSTIPANYSQIGTKEVASKYDHLQDIQDEIPVRQNVKVGILIGCNCAAALAPINYISTDQPFAQKTALGWSLCGTASSFNNSFSTTNTVCNVATTHKMCNNTSQNDFDRIAKILESDFNEPKADQATLSQQDKRFMEIIKNSIHQNEEGFYEMKLPFKNEHPQLPDNQVTAFKRLQYLKRRLEKDQQYYSDYTEFMNKILDCGDAEPIPHDELDRPGWYIPHHAVYHKMKKGKIRVVFDCSSTYKGTSLNQELLQGPDLMNSLLGILLRFRLHPVAFIGDIERMYHRFRVAESDRNYLRFYWYENGDLNSTPKKYRMKVLLFGSISSPACAIYALKKMATDHATSDNKDAVDYLTRNFYVDDGLCCTETVDESIQIIKKTREICSKANVRLHKFISNNNEVLQSVPESERAAKPIQDLPVQTDMDRVLGLKWNTNTDTLHFASTLQQKPMIRRGILSIVASIFDPLGLISPTTLQGKLILQKICKQKKSWDDPLDDETISEWKNWLKQLDAFADVKINRCYKPINFGEAVERQIHFFSDASFTGYGACAYIKMLNKKGDVHCSLVIAKSRVTPQKVHTIPRLELIAAQVAVKLSVVLQNELQTTPEEHFFWTDSNIVLSYLANDAKRFHVFVANRVQYILNHTDVSQWRYVTSKENPADYASRGLNAKELLSSTWLHGPPFLLKPLAPSIQFSAELSKTDPEVKKICVNRISAADPSLYERLMRFSDWKRLIAAIYTLKFFLQSKRKLTSTSQVDGIKNTEKFIIRLCQKQHLGDTYEIIKRREALHDKHLSSLDLFIDNDDLIRVGGRIQSSLLDYDVKHPILLPNMCHVTQLLIKHFHEQSEHQGKGITLATIRSYGFHIIGASRLVSSFIYKCVRCRRLRHQPMNQKMCDLPADRTEPAPPFHTVGIDVFGPYKIIDKRKELKRYGLIFVCQASRAVHIELLEDMTTDTFINSLRSFIAIRGTVAVIRCDQGTNFVGASKELKQSFQQIKCDRVKKILLKQHCEFVLNSPHSSHMGGTFERHIRTARSILNNILYKQSQRLDTSSLRTFFYEVMSLVNSRPLSYMYLHDTQLEPLTPNHLIMMKPRTVTPAPGEFSADDVYAKKRWRRVQELVNQFWKRWRNEYLVTLQTRQKWKTSSRNIQVNDIVIVKDNTTYRGEWKMGRVQEILPTRDNHPRRVKLQMSGEKTLLERPIHQLVLLLEAE